MFSNINSSEAFEALKEYMINNYNAKLVSGGREILKRCHICGDSRDPTNAHMYIGLRDGAIVYNCFKCNAKGLVDGKFLRDMNCYDTNIIYMCQEQNKKSSNHNSAYSGELRCIKPRNVVIPLSNNEYAIKKLDYISRRLGYIFNASDVARFKIILNLKDFLIYNGIEKYTRDSNMIDLIDKFFIGFLSMDNKYIILRRLVPEGKLPQYIDSRYLNYNIFGTNDGMKHYIIPNQINVLHPLEIHIAEGAFDIMSIYMNVAQLGVNAIFAAVCGKTYLSLIQHFITIYGFTVFDLHLYPDSDVSNSEMIKIKNSLSVFNIRIFIHRNMYSGEKDYGVSRDRISDSCSRI